MFTECDIPRWQSSNACNVIDLRKIKLNLSSFIISSAKTKHLAVICGLLNEWTVASMQLWLRVSLKLFSAFAQKFSNFFVSINSGLIQANFSETCHRSNDFYHSLRWITVNGKHDCKRKKSAGKWQEFLPSTLKHSNDWMKQKAKIKPKSFLKNPSMSMNSVADINSKEKAKNTRCFWGWNFTNPIFGK